MKYPKQIQDDLKNLDGDTSRIEDWLGQQHDYIVGARSVLREVQLILRDAMKGSKAKRSEAIQKAHDVITASFPDFDEVPIPNDAELQSWIDEAVAQGLLEKVGEDEYRLTEKGKAFVEQRLKDNPETRDFMRKLQSRLGKNGAE